MKILGLGDNVFDVYQNLNISYPGGNAVNVAVNATQLGIESAYLGYIADDCYGYYLKSILKSLNIDITHCHYLNNTSTKQCIQDVIDGERQFIKVDLGQCWTGPIHLLPKDLEYIHTFDVVFTNCNAKLEDQLYLLKDISGIVSYDFGEKEKYRQETYFQKVIPYIDLVQFSMNHLSIQDIKEKINSYSIHKPILITRGNEIPLFFTGNERIEGVKHQIKAKDTMGAGDAYITAFVYSLVNQGWKKKQTIKKEWIEKAMNNASLYASNICMQNGAFGKAYPNKELKAVIFDMDGVIVDSEAHWQYIFESMVQKYGKTLSDADKREFYGCSLEKEVEILSRYIYLSKEEIMDLRQKYCEKYPMEYRKYMLEGVKELITYLKSKHIKIAIASSNILNEIKNMVNECGLNAMFDCIISGDMFERSKPDPAIYNYAVSLLEIPRENIYVIEDSEYGIEAACLAGLDVLAIKNQYYQFDLSAAQLEFSSHKDILEYIKKAIIKED